MNQLLPPKKDVALALLERSNVDVYLDPRARGVVVPPQFRKEPRLILKIGLNMPVPIPDLQLDEEGVSCTLSFNRSPFFCIMPWSSVFALVGEDGRGMVWPEDVPGELAAKVMAAPESSARVPDAASSSENVSGGSRAPAASAAKRPRRSRRSQGASDENASDVPPTPAKRASKKRGAQPEPSGRPTLVALPRPSTSSAVADGGDLEPSVSATDSRETSNAVSAPPASPRVDQRPPGSSRPKRPLPPYLRVVK